MTELQFDEPVFEKETQNFARYRVSRMLSEETEVRGTFYLPKGSQHVKISIEYE